MHSLTGCLHSSALDLTSAMRSHFRNVQFILILSKYPPCGTGRYVFLRYVNLWCLMISAQVLFVAEPLPKNRAYTQRTGTTLPGARPAHSLPIRMLAHLGLILCCASPQHINGNAHPAQQQEGQSQTQHQQGRPHGQSHAQV